MKVTDEIERALQIQRQWLAGMSVFDRLHGLRQIAKVTIESLEAALAAAKPNMPHEKLDEIDELANLIRQIVSVEMKADAEIWPMTIAAHALVITDHTAELRAAASGTLPEEPSKVAIRAFSKAYRHYLDIPHPLPMGTPEAIRLGLIAYLAVERQKGEADG